MSIGGSIGKWKDTWQDEKLYVFDLLPDNTIGYIGHGSHCTHYWNKWFDPLYQKGGKAYVYKPTLPGQDKNTIYYAKQNWRELIYQMALDYQQYGHNDNYAVKLAQLNPEYQNGRTGYESYYADFLAEDGWRSIYNPASEDSKNFFVGNMLTDKEKIYYGWNRNVINDPTLLNFWIDFVEDGESTIGKYSVRAIGNRPKIVNNDAIRAIIYRDIPNIIYITPEKYELQK
jgi:hypothetical protein